MNVDKTKTIQLLFGKRSSVSKVNPFDVCGEWVVCNSIQCMKCQRWIGSARIGSAWKTFQELNDVLIGKQGLSLKQWGKINQCCVRPV